MRDKNRSHSVWRELVLAGVARCDPSVRTRWWAWRRRSVNLFYLFFVCFDGGRTRTTQEWLTESKVSRSECQTKTDFNAAELSMQALHGHAAGSLTSTRWPPPRPHLDGVTRAIFVNHFSAIGSSMSTPRTCTRAVTATCSTFTCSMLIWAVEGREEHESTRRESDTSSSIPRADFKAGTSILITSAFGCCIAATDDDDDIVLLPCMCSES